LSKKQPKKQNQSIKNKLNTKETQKQKKILNKIDQIQNKNKNEEHEKYRNPTQQRKT
jgi:hypothetical protein